MLFIEYFDLRLIHLLKCIHLRKFISTYLIFCNLTTFHQATKILSLNVTDQSTVQFAEQNMLCLHYEFSLMNEF